MLGVGAAGQLVGVEQLLLPEPRLHPRVEPGAEPRRRRRRPRHRPGQLAGERVGVVAQPRPAPWPTGWTGSGTSTASAPVAPRLGRAAARARRPSRRPALGSSDQVERRWSAARSGRALARPARPRRAGAATSAPWPVHRPRPATGRRRRSGLGVALDRLVAATRSGRLAPRRSSGRARRAGSGDGPNGVLRARLQQYDDTDERCSARVNGDVAEPQLLLGLVRRESPREGVEAPPCHSRPAAAGRARRRAAASAGPPAPVVHIVRDRLVGNFVSQTPTRNTASHSRPLARWTVSSLTESASVGVATSRPLPWLVLGRRGRPAAPAGVTSPSTAWNSATALTNRSRLSRRARAAGLTDEAELDVDAGGVDDPADEVEQRLAGVAAQRAQLVGQQREALARLRRSTSPPPGSSRASLSEATSVGSAPSTASTSSSPTLCAASPDAAPAAAGQLAARPAEQSQVALPDRPARTGEQRQQLGVGGQVVQQRQRRDDLGDLGQPEQALEARRSRPGSRPPVERVEDVGGVRVVAGQHADLRHAARPRAWAAWTALGQPGQLVGIRLEDGGRDDSPGAAPGLASSGGTWSERGVERLGEPVGHRRGSGVSERRLTVSGYVGTAVGRRRPRGTSRRSRGCWTPTRRASRRSPGWGRRPRSPRGPRPAAGVGPENSRESISAWATEVSWYSSSRTILNFSALDRADLGLLGGQPGAELDLVGEVHQPEVGA